MIFISLSFLSNPVSQNIIYCMCDLITTKYCLNQISPKDNYYSTKGKKNCVFDSHMSIVYYMYSINKIRSNGIFFIFAVGAVKCIGTFFIVFMLLLRYCQF